MDLIKKQAELDKRKYLKSEKEGQDLSGKMAYCKRCKYQALGFCGALQKKREAETLCAVAWENKYRGAIAAK